MFHPRPGSSPAAPWADLTHEERIEAVRPLLAKGKSATDIAIALHAGTRGVIIGFVYRYLQDAPRVRKRHGAGRRPARPKAARKPPAKAARKPLGPPLVPAEPLPVVRLSLPATRLYIETDSHHCQYMDGDPLAQPITQLMCCGRPVDYESTWCSAHKRLVFGPSVSRRSRERLAAE